MKNDRNKDINDEIKRIKSLFTEERLYGNLIDEQKKKLLPNWEVESLIFMREILSAYYTANPDFKTKLIY